MSNLQNIKVLPVVQYARAHTEDAIGVLVDIMLDTTAKETARVAAAAQILDRGWGKPAQQVTISENPKSEFDLSSLTQEELQAFHDLLGKVAQNAEVVDEKEHVDADNMKRANVTPITTDLAKTSE